MPTLQDLQTPITPNWCPGCGDFGIWAAFKNAVVQESWDDTNSAIVAGIGCHGHIINFVNMTAFEGLHGRAIPVATGIKLANHKLNVFVFTGDGDMLAEGGNHFTHACRRNHDLTIILHDNAIYGLTTGQTSPRSAKGYVSKSTPEGNLDEPLNPMALALVAGATFVARGYSGDIPKLTELMIKAQQHKGLAFVDVLQPCVTFHKEYTHMFYQQNTYWLDEKHDRTDKVGSISKAMEWGEKKIALGVFYEEERPSYEDQVKALAAGPLAEREVVKRDLGKLYKKYM
jgi:2-oxoglutarate ferredoxin oxidoreductase subunit beta